MATRFAFVVLAFVLAAIAAGPAVAAPLPALNNWVIDFGETECTALRKFGNANDPVDFMIRPAFNGESFELFFGRKGSGRDEATTLRGTVDLGRGDQRGWFVRARPAKSGLSVVRVRVPDADVRSSRSGRIRVKVRTDEFHLASGSLANVLKTLDMCVADLRAYWNDKAPADVVATSPVGNIRSVFTAADYPDEAVLDLVEGAVRYTLLIDEKGEVVGCDPLMATGAPILELMGCQVIVGRAKFAPARDKGGKPVRSTYVTPAVRWVLE